MGDVQFQKRPSRNIITGEIYPIQARRYLENHHEGIVGRELWQKAQTRLRSFKVKDC